MSQTRSNARVRSCDMCHSVHPGPMECHLFPPAFHMFSGKCPGAHALTGHRSAHARFIHIYIHVIHLGNTVLYHPASIPICHLRNSIIMSQSTSSMPSVSKCEKQLVSSESNQRTRKEILLVSTEVVPFSTRFTLLASGEFQHVHHDVRSMARPFGSTR